MDRSGLEREISGGRRLICNNEANHVGGWRVISLNQVREVEMCNGPVAPQRNDDALLGREANSLQEMMGKKSSSVD